MIDIEAELREMAADLDIISRGEEANWRMAERTARCTLDAGDVTAGRNNGKIAMAEWCRRVREVTGRRFSEDTGQRYKRLWLKYGGGLALHRIPWSDAYAEDTGGKVHERMAAPMFNAALNNATPEQKQDFFQRIVREEPAVVQQAWQDTETNIALSEARWKARDQALEPLRAEQRDTAPIFEPKDSALDRRNLLASIALKVDQWTRELNGIRDILEYTDDVDWGRRWATRQALDRLVQAATVCRDTLPSSAVPAAEQSTHTTRRAVRRA